jgi:hypothetical protein
VTCYVKYDIVKELKRTFEDDKVEIVQLSTRIITNYNSTQPEEYIEDIRKAILKLKYERFSKMTDEIYVALVGGVYHGVATVLQLERLGIPYKLLVYEKKVEKYVIINPSNFRVEGIT